MPSLGIEPESSTFAGSRANPVHFEDEQEARGVSRRILAEGKGVEPSRRESRGLANRPSEPYLATFQISGPHGSRTHHTDLARISRRQRHGSPVITVSSLQIISDRGGNRTHRHEALDLAAEPVCVPGQSIAEAVRLELTSGSVAATCFRDRVLIQPDDFRNFRFQI